MRVRADVPFKVGRWCAEASRHYEIPERAAYVVANGWATELPDDDPAPYETISRDMLGTDAPRPAADDVTLDVQSVTHGIAVANVGG